MNSINLCGKVVKKAQLKNTNAGALLVLTVEERDTYQDKEKVQQWPLTFWKERATEIDASVFEGDIVEALVRFSRSTGEDEQGNQVTRTNITGVSCKILHSPVANVKKDLGTSNAQFGGTSFPAKTTFTAETLPF